ncbi:histidine kinase, partial [Metapseudomonas otitidis]
WQLPVVIQQAIAYQARPMQAPAEAQLSRVLAQAVLVSEALQAHGGATDEARASLDGPLMEGVDLVALFNALPAVLEADKAFAELLG